MIGLDTLLNIVQLLIGMGTLITMAYALNRFLKKPKDSLEARVAALELEMKDVKVSLLHGNDKFRKQNDVTEVILHSVLALIDFEMQYCLTEKVQMSDGLKDAKEDLQRFLSKRGEKE
jgi:hypothetical protein